MSPKNALIPAIHLALAVLLLIGCSAAEDTPTPPTDTPAPPAPATTETGVPPTPTPTETAVLPAPVLTDTPVPPTLVPPTPTCVYDMSFVTDVTIPDDSAVLPGVGFRKTWRIGNSGNCPWPGGTDWVFANGSQMGGPSAVPVPVTNPGETADVSVDLVAPGTPGPYTGYWTLRLPEGRTLDQRYFVRIVVPEPTPTPTTEPPTPTPTPITEPPKPVVIILDSADPTVVYHEETRDAGETNADDIARILANLPIETRKETTSPQWERQAQVRAQNPKLIIIHISAFYDPNGSNTKFAEFLDYMRDSTPTKFLIYSRAQSFSNEEHYKQRLEIIYKLQGRLEVLYVRFRWDQDDVPQRLKNKVRSLLEMN